MLLLNCISIVQWVCDFLFYIWDLSSKNRFWMLVLWPYFSSLYIISTSFKPWVCLAECLSPLLASTPGVGKCHFYKQSFTMAAISHAGERSLRKQNCVSGKVPTKYYTLSTLLEYCPQINEVRIGSPKGWATFKFSEDARHFWRWIYGVFFCPQEGNTRARRGIEPLF